MPAKIVESLHADLTPNSNCLPAVVQDLNMRRGEIEDERYSMDNSYSEIHGDLMSDRCALLRPGFTATQPATRTTIAEDGTVGDEYLGESVREGGVGQANAPSKWESFLVHPTATWTTLRQRSRTIIPCLSTDARPTALTTPNELHTTHLDTLHPKTTTLSPTGRREQRVTKRMVMTCMCWTLRWGCPESEGVRHHQTSSSIISRGHSFVAPSVHDP